MSSFQRIEKINEFSKFTPNAVKFIKKCQLHEISGMIHSEFMTGELEIFNNLIYFSVNGHVKIDLDLMIGNNDFVGSIDFLLEFDDLLKKYDLKCSKKVKKLELFPIDKFGHLKK